MKMDFEVISRDTIKPSAPTPHHLRYYQLSFIDRIAPLSKVPFIYFFSVDPQLTKVEISNRLKTSLSKVLTSFYPLAGRLNNNNYIDCNDEGVLFLEAQVNCQLSQILQEVNPEVKRFLPVPDGVGNQLLDVQVTFFTCGNFAICAHMSHKIGDGPSYLTFINNWAATARLDANIACPKFVSAKLFPPKGDGLLQVCLEDIHKDVMLKRFVFKKSVISNLKESYAYKSSTTENLILPTRIEALISFIWSRFSASTGTNIRPDKPLLLLNTANLRKRMDPPLPDDVFGNFFRDAVTLSSQDPTGEDSCGLVKKLRESLSLINGDSVRKLQDGTLELAELRKRMAQDANMGEVVEFWFSSLCRYPVYEADFGWGKPVWVAWGGIAYKYFVFFLDTKSGDGIEAWVHLKKEDMAKFETDKMICQLC